MTTKGRKPIPGGASEAARTLGAGTLSEVARYGQTNLQRLQQWHKARPEFFRVVVLGAMQAKAIDTCEK